MADDNDATDAAERLERALERIAARAASAGPMVDADSRQHDSETEADVSRRLDALIGRIRAVLGPQAGG